MHQEARTVWKEAKQVLTMASPGLFKWWVGSRFQGHHRDQRTKCKCPEGPTVTQTHIIACSRFERLYEATTANFGLEEGEVMTMLRTRDPETSTREDYKRLNEVEDHLSALIL